MKTRLKEAREQAGLTQEDLAAAVDATRQTILFLEKEKYNPSLRLAWRISKVLEKPLEELFDFEDEDWKPST
ncbi:MAG: helix-turn-helix transcriptional regulator [Candidatus Bathyarchaeota archaeon]|nr:helix-turn-helix transcriptional regulator [Candidatus Bathyarchaeota archaeon]